MNGLQPPLHPVLGRKGAQQGFVAFAQGFHVSQHQGRDFVTASQLQLGQGLTGVHLANQRTQRQQQAADMGRQDRANFHVGNVTAFALVKANEHLAFFDHIAHRQPGAVAVTPGRPLNRAQHGFGFDFAQVPKVVFEHPLLDGHLGRDLQVLHFAPAAGPGMQAKIRAAWPHALRRLVVNLGDRALLPVVLFAVHVDRHQLERQSTFDEHNFAVRSAGDALGIHVQGTHTQPALG
jgi:hypothetical protein